MNKRTISRCGTFVASLAFIASSFAGSAAAAGKYDLAKYVDEFDMQTVGYSTAATSDGGYIVGGKTLACIAHALVLRGDENSYEFVSLEKCMDEDRSEGRAANGSNNSYGASLGEYCGNEGPKSHEPEGIIGNPEVLEETDEEEPIDYDLVCMDYMAKYDKNGKGLWMTPVEDNSKIIGVGETNIDYRMVTENGKVHIFEKSDGESDYYNYGGYAEDVKINKDGSFIILDDGWLYLFSKTGTYVREFEEDDNEEYYFRYMGISNDQIIATVVEYDENSGTETSKIVSISNDLKTVKTRLSSTKDYLMAMSGSTNGDIIILREKYDAESDSESYWYESYDKDNKKIAGIDVTEDESFVFFNNYVATNDMNLIMQRFMNGGFGADGDTTETPYLALYSRELKEIARVELTASEVVNDTTVINNGTLVTAGELVGSSNDNGLRIHLAAATSGKPTDINNPDTGDNIQYIAIMGGVAALGATVLVSKKFARR